MRAAGTLPFLPSRRLPRTRLEPGVDRPAGPGRRLARLIGGAAAIVAMFLAAGAAYEAIAASTDTSRYPAAGQMVDVGGYRLHLTCLGQGNPTIVLDAGLGGSSLDWILVQPELANSTRVCAYDRAGMGWSDPGPGPRSPARIAEDLHRLLVRAGVPGPYVLVAHSLAGKGARLFAAAHPDEVAGMVLVDTRSERVDALMSVAQTQDFDTMLASQARLLSIARRLGVARFLGSRVVAQPSLPPGVATEMVLMQTGREALNTMMQEGIARSADDAVLAYATLGGMPLVVIAAGESLVGIPHWREAQSALAALSSNGRIVVAEGSSHLVQIDQPEIVIEAVRSVVATARGGICQSGGC